MTGLRVATAVLLGGALLLVILLAPAAGRWRCIALVMLIGAWEWSGFLRTEAPATRALYMAVTRCCWP